MKSLRVDYHCLEPALIEDLVDALPNMKNLKELRIRLGASLRNHHIASLNDILS